MKTTLKTTILAISSIVITTSVFAAKIDHEIFWDCLSYGRTVDYCTRTVQTHYHETTPSGTVILRGNQSPIFRPEIEQVPETDTTIFRGR